ncbi:MAG TPA: VOC family protein [Longimicrobium sp.]|nr:VOC family protein [Longimicrobium sp.]
MFRLEGIDHVALTVRDVRRSAHWYVEVLGLERRFADEWGDFPAVVGIGATSLALFPVKGSDPRPPPGPDTLCFRHVAFRVDRESFERARETLTARGIQLEFQDHGAAHSLYLADPDGHQLEITTYEVPDRR